MFGLAKKEGKSKAGQGKQQGPGLNRKTMLLLAAFIVFIASGTALLALFAFPQESEPTPITSHLIEFYGKECPHCQRMAPVVSQVEQEQNVSFSKLEVWHNSGNQKVMDGYADAITAACEGGMAVPAFYNNNSGKALCGEVGKEELKAFVLGTG